MNLIAPGSLTLMEALMLLSKGSSRNTLRSWLEKGRVTVDGKVVKKGNITVTAGQEVSLGQRIRFIESDVKVIYEDKDLIVIDKPAGLLSVATNFDKEVTAHAILKRRYYSQRVYPVHRLDRETSGVMLFAYSEVARDELKAKFKAHDIQREYYAVVEGSVKTPTGHWQTYLLEDERYMVKSSPNANQGRLSITHYETLAQNANYSLLRLLLETGRKNQIRVHCKEAGHPVAGDIKYGGKASSANRLCLHAGKLGFVHPVLNKKLVFESALPETFFRLVTPN